MIVVLNPLHLHTLHVVLRAGSFADAGRELGYTGSAVSQQISALERYLGFPLLERGPQGVTPNATARFIDEQSADALGRLRTLEESIRLNFQGEVGTLRIGTFATAAEIVLPFALAQFRAERPAVVIQMQEGYLHDLIPRLQARELDIALTYRYGNVHTQIPKEFKVKSLYTEKLSILANSDHPLHSDSVNSLRGLENEDWISTGPQSSETVMLRQFAAAVGFRPNIAFHVQNFRSFQALIEAGMGVALMPTTGYTPTPKVTATALDAPNAYREVILVRAPGTTDGLFNAIHAALVESTSELSERWHEINLIHSNLTQSNTNPR